MNLYQIDIKIAEALARFESEEVEALKLLKDAKLSACWYALRNLDAETSAYDAEIERLRATRDSLKRRHEWLKGYVATSLGEGNTFADGVAKFGWRKSEAVEVSELEKTPEAYRRIKWEPAKDVIKVDLKSGATVPGWKLVERQHLQIK